MKKISLLFSAGCLGALVNSLVLWQLGQLGVIRAIQVAMNPALTPQWLYPRIVWGGIWGIVFLLPMLNTKPVLKGSIISLFPTAVQLFIVFPFKAHKGMAGLDLGLMTPLLVLAVNWVWGVVTAITIKTAK